jgi:hypothetical protein
MLQWEKRLKELEKSAPKAKKKQPPKKRPPIPKDGGRYVN